MNKGRPTKFKNAYIRQSEVACRMGAVDEDLADLFGVSSSTINNWKKEFPDFLESIKKGKAFADTNVVQALYRRAVGYSIDGTGRVVAENETGAADGSIKHFPPDITACIFWLKNRLPDQWNEKFRVDHKADIVTKIVREII